MTPLLRQLITVLAQIGASPQEDDDTRLRRILGIVCTMLGAVASSISAVAYLVGGAPWASLLWVGFVGYLLLGLIMFQRQAINYRIWSHLAVPSIALASLISTWLFGGLLPSSLVIVWGLLTPLLSLVLMPRSQVVYWMLVYIALLIVSAVMMLYVTPLQRVPFPLEVGLMVYNLAGSSLFAIIVLYYFVAQREVFQEKSENLLLNILPKEIAAILKNENRIIADQFEGASILFADVVGFTPMSAQMTPVELVELLNEIFSHFDALVEKYDLEKIKTIGDCYMVASGVPRPRIDHAHALTHMALEMQAFIATRTFQGRTIAFRIGINSGPVVAGVIGRKKFIYDLWGDAVNTASRMESHGSANVIQITEATYQLVKTAFVCEPKGTVHVKGKGEMEVWHVVGARIANDAN